MTVADALDNPAPRPQPHRAAAGLLPAREGKDREALAGRRGLHPQPQDQRVLRRRGRQRRHHLPGRHVQCRHPRAAAPGPRRHLWRHRRADLRAERRLSAGRRRVPRLLRGQGRRARRRGRPAQLHRAGHGRHAAQGRPRHEDRRQGNAADGRRIHRPGHARRHRRLPARRGAGHAARRGARAQQGRPTPIRSRTSPPSCPAARRASAPAARSGRSSRR